MLGADELSGCHSAEVGSVEGRVATALVASPVGEDATFYVRAVTPQIVLALIMRSINKSDQYIAVSHLMPFPGFTSVAFRIL